MGRPAILACSCPSLFAIRYSQFAFSKGNPMASVILRYVRKTYPSGFEAIKGIGLEVGDGQFCVLVGPSGCGKSTLLRMVAGLETISGGDIDIGGRVVHHPEPAPREIAMVFPKYSPSPPISVYKNIASIPRNPAVGHPPNARPGLETAR